MKNYTWSRRGYLYIVSFAGLAIAHGAYGSRASLFGVAFIAASLSPGLTGCLADNPIFESSATAENGNADEDSDDEGPVTGKSIDPGEESVGHGAENSGGSDEELPSEAAEASDKDSGDTVEESGGEGAEEDAGEAEDESDEVEAEEEDEGGSEEEEEPESLLSCAEANSSNLVACYPFDNFSDTEEERGFEDFSSYGNHLYGGNARIIVDAIRGPVVSFNGNSDLAAEDSLSLDFSEEMTLSVWVRVNRYPTFDEDHFGIFEDNEQYGIFLYSDDSVGCRGGEPEYVFGRIPLLQWTHLACTRQANGLMQLFVDGVLVNQLADSFPLPTFSGDELAVGNTSPLFDDGMFGRMDELSIWNVALSEQTIERLAKNDPELFTD